MTIRRCSGFKNIEERGATRELNAAPERYFENQVLANLWKPRGTETRYVGTIAQRLDLNRRNTLLV